MNKKKMIIIDGNSLMNRAFYAIRDLVTKDGVHTNAVYGFFNMIFKLLEEFEPTHMSVAFDMRAPTFRHKEYTEYKGTRKGMADELAMQFPIVKEIVDAMGLHRMELAGFEADDLIGTVASLSSDEGMEVIVVTGDKDALQLVNDNINILFTKKGISNVVRYTEKEVFEEFELSPMQVVDYKGLSGDSSDNIPGIPGIGPKTAIKMLREFGTVENLIANVDSITNKRHKNLVTEYSAQALMSKRLATIMINVPIEFSSDEFVVTGFNYDKLRELLSKYELKSLLKRIAQKAAAETNQISMDFGETASSETEEKSNIVITFIDDKEAFAKMEKDIRKNEKMSIYFIYDKKNITNDGVAGISISTTGEQNYFVDKTLIMDLKPILEDEKIKKCAYEMKKDMLICMQHDIELRGVWFDVAIAQYLLEPGRAKYSLADLAYEHLNVFIPAVEDLLGKGAKAKKYVDVAKEELASYASKFASASIRLSDDLVSNLEKEGLTKLFEEVEMPLVEILASLEHEGFNVNKQVLADLDEILTKKIGELEIEIYSFTQEKFNINSPKQLGVILFEELKLPVIKKTKTGYSTGHEILVKLMNEHPIIPLVIEYRTYAKLKSTYIDGLYPAINETTGRIHSSFNQTVAVTGRLSSTEPNLQNIPVRLPIGREIRKVFIASEGNVLIGADYSQVELRVLAHYTQDPGLLKAFKENLDIHALTASNIFDIPVEEVTSVERGRAKEVNFGVIYGMSDFGLSESLKISRKKAKEYIENYFIKYPKVKEFLDKTIEDCRENGYVVTILGRRRYIPDINSSKFMLKSFAERTAMNTPIQGSAADIIKLAMINVYRELKERNLKSKLILQVHDELIIDTHPDEIEEVKVLLRENMMNVISDFSVPLEVDMNVGKSWFEAK